MLTNQHSLAHYKEITGISSSWNNTGKVERKHEIKCVDTRGIKYRSVIFLNEEEMLTTLRNKRNSLRSMKLIQFGMSRPTN
jgi:hypothetical protein